MEEYLDIVDARDNVIGFRKRSEVYKERMINFRVINAFIMNDDRKIWIPRRSPHKKLFPLCLDASVGGHVMSGESYDDAFKRELGEELNIDAGSCSYSCIGSLNPHDHGVSAFMRLYVIKSNDEPRYNKDDFIEAYWFSKESFFEAIASGDVCKGDLPKLVEYLYNSL